MAIEEQIFVMLVRFLVKPSRFDVGIFHSLVDGDTRSKLQWCTQINQVRNVTWIHTVRQ